MNDAADDRRAGARTVCALAAAAGLVLLTAACGAPSAGAHSPGVAPASAAGFGGSPNAAAPAGSPSALGFSRCMRAHGVPNFPDPPANFTGKFPGSSPQQLGVSESVIQTATRACQSLLPVLPGQAPLTAADQQDYLRAAACMRAHGVTGFPDPDFSGGTVHFPIPASVDTGSRQFAQARQTCEKLIPAGLPYSNG